MNILFDSGAMSTFVYAMVLITLLLLHIRKIHKFNVTSFALILYSITAVSAFFFYILYGDFVGFNNITYLSYIRWLILFIVGLYPIYKFDQLDVGLIDTTHSFYKWIGYISLVVGIPVIIELAPRIIDIFSNIDNFWLSASDIHDDDVKDLGLSSISTQSMRVVRWLYDLDMILLIPILASKQDNVVKSGIICLIFAKNFPNIINVSRGGLLLLVLNLMCCYILFKGEISKRVKTKIKIYGSVIIAITLVLFSGITISRQKDYDISKGDYSMDYFLLRYSGEGPLNYNQYAEDANGTLEGNITLYAFKKLVGLKAEEVTRDFFYGSEAKLGIPLNIFYTYIGTFVLDIGLVATFLLLFFVSFLMVGILNRQRGVLTLSTIFLFYIYIRIILFGFNGFVYTGTATQLILVDLLLYAIMKNNRL